MAVEEESGREIQTKNERVSGQEPGDRHNTAGVEVRGLDWGDNPV